MKKIYKKILALIYTVILFVGGFGNIGQTQAAVDSVTNKATVSGTLGGQQEYIQDGVTLHCWNWSYKNIEANMALIAASGYTAIQTSPIQQCKEATSHQSMNAWWLYYQPMGFHIDDTGKSALGTKDEFESMVATAHEYGVKVIVDVVANHLGDNGGNNLSPAIIDDLEKDPSCWHDYTKNTSNYNSRFEITQYCMSGLPDLNTWNEKVQNYVIDYLKECIDAGVDGFRFDAAKHIEVPVDTDNCKSEFWPNVIGKANAYATTKGKMMYYYGELLDTPGGGIPSSAYTTYMSITDNSWGNQLRGSVSGGDANGYNSGYHKGNDVYADKLVLWAESHDTYAGGESKGVSTQKINKTWALVAARNAAMGLYFARPASADLTSVPMGSASITGWADAEVVAVNKFHNEFAGQSEYIAKENGIAYCIRGNSGVVLVNCKGDDKYVDVTNCENIMKDGTYVDQITGNTFTVSGGRIKGQIGGTGIAVVCKSTTSATANNIAYIELPSNWGDSVTCYVYGTNGKENAEWPGVKMTNVSGNLYKYEVPDDIKNPRVVFYSSDSNRYPGDYEPGLSLYGEMVYKNGIWSVYSTNQGGGSGSTTDTPGTGDNSSQGNTGDNNSDNNSGSGNSGNSDNSGSGNSGNSGSSGSGNSGSDGTSNNNSENDTDKPATDTDNKDDESNETVADDNQNSDDDNNIEETTDKGSEKETDKDDSEDSTDPKDDTTTIGTLPSSENSSDANEDNKEDGKKFPWPAVVIPIVVLGIGAAVIVYVKVNKASE